MFVCLGNICRSPAAEAIFASKIQQHGLDEKLHIESSGTSSAHVGEMADHRMREHASSRGYELSKKSQKFTEEDLIHYDYIVAMDKQNCVDIRALDNGDDLGDKLFLVTDFCSKFNHDEVPDPYYGEANGFDLVLDILEDATEGLVKKIEKDL
jgi:protein-tyrosine phosphatase